MAAGIGVGAEVGGCTVGEGCTDDSGDVTEVTAVAGTGSCDFVGFSGEDDDNDEDGKEMIRGTSVELVALEAEDLVDTKDAGFGLAALLIAEGAGWMTLEVPVA